MKLCIFKVDCDENYVTTVCTCHRLGGSAKHRKREDFHPQGAQTAEPILMKLGMVDYVRPHMTTLVAQRGWSGQRQIYDLPRSFLYFFLFFLLSSARAQVAFLDRSGRSIRQ